MPLRKTISFLIASYVFVIFVIIREITVQFICHTMFMLAMMVTLNYNIYIIRKINTYDLGIVWLTSNLLFGMDF